MSRIDFDLGSRSCLDYRTPCGSSSINTRAYAPVFLTPHSVRVEFNSHKGSRSCLDYRTRCGSSSIHTRAQAFVVIAALGAGQVRFAQGLRLLSGLAHFARVKFNSHRGSRSCFDYRTQCESSLTHTRAHALVLTTATSRCGLSSIHTMAHAFVLITAHGADRFRFTLGLTLFS